MRDQTSLRVDFGNLPNLSLLEFQRDSGSGVGVGMLVLAALIEIRFVEGAEKLTRNYQSLGVAPGGSVDVDDVAPLARHRLT